MATNKSKDVYDNTKKREDEVIAYRDVKEHFMECIGHDDAVTKMVDLFKKRNDFEQLIVQISAKNIQDLFVNTWFGRGIISAIILAVAVPFLMFLPSQTRNHIVQKAVNSQVPDLLPLPENVNTQISRDKLPAGEPEGYG